MKRSGLRLFFALALLVISLAALAWGLLPGERTVLHQKIQPTEMQLPTPQGNLPAQSFLAGLVVPNNAVRTSTGAERFLLPD